MPEDSPLSREWQILQQQHELIEKSALGVKLVAIITTFVSLAVAVDLLLVGVLLLVLWLQEAIVRTGQARLGARLLQIETLMHKDVVLQGGAFQLHTVWQANRGGSMALVGEYLAHAVRPTVAFPYAVLLLILLAALSVPVA